jgi:hypothetical protein
MASDPHRWAMQFGQNQQQRANQSQGDYQNALMAVFGEEAARQRPYATMPANLAEAQFNRENALPMQLAEEERQLRRWYEQQDYSHQQDIEMQQLKAELGTDVNPLDALLSGAGGVSSSPTVNADGSTTYMVNGKPIVVPAVR